jgi:hypothetical protein|tara:strand:- start:2770 stop:3252 length:483 start_codon:yes stop_codon:yes gene_type:complete
MPRGYKACAECDNKEVSIASKKCKCGSTSFLKRPSRYIKRSNNPQAQGHFRLKKFISRSLQGKLSKDKAARELHVAKIVLNIFCEDYDFLAKFTVPSWIKERNTLLWFKTKDGKKYLERKYNEYLFQPEIKQDIIVDEGELKGENVEYKKKKTLREFLDE